MLHYVANFFQILIKITNFAYVLILLSGKFVFHVVVQSALITYNVLSTIATWANIICEELRTFFFEIYGDGVSVLDCAGKAISNTCNITIRTVESIITTICGLITGTQDLSVQLTKGLTFLAECLFQLLEGSLKLIGNIAWDLLTFLPNLLIAVFYLIYNAISQLTIIVPIFLKRLLYAFFNLPKQSIAGLVVVLLLLKYKRGIYLLLRNYVPRFCLSIAQHLINTLWALSRQNNSNTSNTNPLPRREETERDEKAGTSSNEMDHYCIVCQERLKCVVLMPCKHLCLCVECSDCMGMYQRNCPLCRAYVKGKMVVYI